MYKDILWYLKTTRRIRAKSSRERINSSITHHKKGENYWNTSVFQDFIIDNNLKEKSQSSRHFMINLILMRLMINLSIK